MPLNTVIIVINITPVPVFAVLFVFSGFSHAMRINFCTEREKKEEKSDECDKCTTSYKDCSVWIVYVYAVNAHLKSANRIGIFQKFMHHTKFSGQSTITNCFIFSIIIVFEVINKSISGDNFSVLSHKNRNYRKLSNLSINLCMFVPQNDIYCWAQKLAKTHH